MRKLINQAIDKQERALGASLNWMREVLRLSFAAFIKFALVAPLGNHRKRLPKDAWHVAKLSTTLQEDCGECVQITVNLALRDGVQPQILEAVLHGKIESRPRELSDVCHFAQIICAGRDDSDLRETLRQKFGDEAFMELALAIASSRLIPTTKRALGYAQSCSLVKISLGAQPQNATAHPANAAQLA